MEVAISKLISNIPATDNGQSGEEERGPETSDTQYMKVVHYSKALPPVSIQAAKVGLDPLMALSRVGPTSPTRPLTVTIPEASSRVQTESSWSVVKRESVITSLVSSVKTEPVPRPPPPVLPRRHETVLVSAQANQAGSMPECPTGLRVQVNPVLKRTSSIADCDVQSSSKRQHVSYARRRERRPTEPPAQLPPESPTVDEPRRTPDEQLRLIMMRDSLVTSPPANSLLHCIARGCSEPSAQSPASPALGGDFITPDFQPSPGNFTVKINQTLVHSPNPSPPVAPMMYIPLNVIAGTPSPGPQSPVRGGNSMLEFSPGHFLSSAHSPSSQLPTQVASFSVDVGHGNFLDSFGPPGSQSPSHFTSVGSFGLGRSSSVTDGGEMTSMLSPGDSFTSLGTLDTDLTDLLAGSTSMLLPPTGLSGFQ